MPNTEQRGNNNSDKQIGPLTAGQRHKARGNNNGSISNCIVAAE